MTSFYHYLLVLQMILAEILFIACIACKISVRVTCETIKKGIFTVQATSIAVGQ